MTWNPFRLLDTLNYFQVIPILSDLQTMFFSAQPSPPPPAIQAGGILFDFSQPSSDLKAIWGAVDDVVMGGVSESSMQLGSSSVRFQGNVSTANSGGFASVRTRNFLPPLDLSAYQGISLRLKGDGQRYKFMMRDEASWDGVAHSYPFDTVTNQWITVRIPFNQLIPVLRAKRVQGGRAFDPKQVRSLQLMLSKFEYDGALNPRFTPGPFVLEMSQISL